MWQSEGPVKTPAKLKFLDISYIRLPNKSFDVVGQVACVTSGHSEVQVRFCLLAMSGVVHELRKSQQAVDIYTIVNDQGHVTYDQMSRDFSVTRSSELVTLHLKSS